MKIINENVKVYEKTRGPITISNISIGDEILVNSNGVNIFSRVNKIVESLTPQSKHRISFNNGCEVRCSGIDINNSYIKPTNNEIINKQTNNEIVNIGWLIGAHLGDGTCDRKLITNKRETYFKYRVRINGDNEDIISRYCNIFNTLSKSDSKYSIDNNKHYKVKVWQYTAANRGVQSVITEYLDGLFGCKTYDGSIPKYIINNNGWIPFIAGLIDTDGTIKENGSIDIGMCMQRVIDDVCIFMSYSGFDYKYHTKTSIRSNEKTLHRLTIYLRSKIVSELTKHITHCDKLAKITTGNAIKYYSPIKFDISDEIYNKLIEKKNNIPTSDKRYSNLQSIKTILRKNKNKIGLASLELFRDINAIDANEYNRIINQLKITKIESIEDADRYFSVFTEIGSIYAGNYGLAACNMDEGAIIFT